jgi:FkbM family methyltransferase
MLKKLKKIFRILFPIDETTEYYFSNQIKLLPNYESYVIRDFGYEVTFKNGVKSVIRNKEHSDLKVFQHIFINKEYEPVLQLLKCNNYSQPFRMIDAGANVGYTSLFFAMHISDANIMAIEPDASNAEQIITQIKLNQFCQGIEVINKALSNDVNKRFELSNEFRDKKDWSITTLESSTGEISSTTISQLLNDKGWEELTFLKIDIEGAERFIFNVEEDLTFLTKTYLIAIEIHDEFAIREKIHELLHAHHFIIFEYGELTIGANSKKYG